MDVKGWDLHMNRRILYLLTAMVFLAAAWSPARAEEPLIRKGDRLTLEKCIEIALRLQPSVLSSRYNVKAREAQLGQAKAPYYPNVNASAGYTHYDAVKKTGDPHTLIDTYNNEAANVTLNQTLYDLRKDGNGSPGQESRSRVVPNGS